VISHCRLPRSRPRYKEGQPVGQGRGPGRGVCAPSRTRQSDHLAALGKLAGGRFLATDARMSGKQWGGEASRLIMWTVLCEKLFDLWKSELPCPSQWCRPRFVSEQVGQSTTLQEVLDYPSPALGQLRPIFFLTSLSAANRCGQGRLIEQPTALARGFLIPRCATNWCGWSGCASPRRILPLLVLAFAQVSGVYGPINKGGSPFSSAPRMGMASRAVFIIAWHLSSMSRPGFRSSQRRSGPPLPCAGPA
jgi:hypothetical protein